MRYFVIFFALVGLPTLAFAEPDTVNSQYVPQLEVIPNEQVNYGKSFTIHAWLASYGNKSDPPQYFVDVLDPQLYQIDSTLWHAREDFVYEFDTTHPAYKIFQSGTYRIRIEKSDNMQRTGIFYDTLDLEIHVPNGHLSPLKQYKSGIPFSEIRCKDSLQLTQRYDGTPVCIKRDSLSRLAERDWIKIWEPAPKDGIAFNHGTIKLDDVYINVQIADTDQKRSRGLMFQEQLPYDQGMLFVFDTPGIYSLWMLNMRFPLDMMWFDKDKHVVYIETGVEPCSTVENMYCPVITPNAEASYILEATSGFVEMHGITTDSKLSWIVRESP